MPEPGSLLERIVTEGRMARDRTRKFDTRDLIAEFAAQVLDEGMTVGRDTAAMIQARIAEIDSLLDEQLQPILEHSQFVELRDRWRELDAAVLALKGGDFIRLVFKQLNDDELEQADEIETLGEDTAQIRELADTLLKRNAATVSALDQTEKKLDGLATSLELLQREFATRRRDEEAEWER